MGLPSRSILVDLVDLVGSARRGIRPRTRTRGTLSGCPSRPSGRTSVEAVGAARDHPSIGALAALPLAGTDGREIGGSVLVEDVLHLVDHVADLLLGLAGDLV